MAARASAASPGRNVSSEIAYLARALKAPSLAGAVERGGRASLYRNPRQFDRVLWVHWVHWGAPALWAGESAVIF